MHTKTKIFIAIFLLLIIFIPFNFNTSHSKYVIEKIFKVATIQTDEKEPTFKLINIVNSNTNYETYANCTHMLTFQIELQEQNIKTNNFTQNNLKIKVGNDYITPTINNFNIISINSNNILYEISISNIIGNGTLQLEIPEGIVIDACNLKNSSTTLQTGIMIDNIAPTLNIQETLQDDSTSLITINSSEEIRNLNDWEISNEQTSLSKVFYNCISYPIPVTDYAQNSSEILIDVKKATNISLSYTSYDQYTTFADCANGHMCGRNIVIFGYGSNLESLLIRLQSSSIDLKLQGKVFLYTHWKEGSSGICTYTKNQYNYGYNPNSEGWFNINTDNICTRLRKQYTQLGGIGINSANQTDINGNNPIPSEISDQNLYGISSVAFRLIDSSKFSIVYQSYIKNVGWQKSFCDGEESILNYDKPISAFRMNLVPKSQKQYLMDYWDRDIGTNNVYF